MSTLSELIKEKESLPIGNIYTKKINGKEYIYYQFFKDGKRFSQIVKNNDIETLKTQIKRRKELETLIAKYRSKEKRVVLSKNAEKITGYLMSGNIPVAKFENGQLLEMNESLVPLVIKKTKSIEKFLDLRVIDMSRTNARILKKALNITIDDETKIPLYAYALSISDDYWFKPKHSKIKYMDIKFNNDIYSDAALKGDLTIFPHKTKLTPEITTTGSFEKGWKMVNGEWWLYKSGKPKQIFSEMFCYKFARLIGINTAIYEIDGEYIRSKNFAEDCNFEPMAAIADNNDNYEFVFSLLHQIDKAISKDYLKLIFFDSVVNNIDRHNENTGLLRERGTGKIISLAPNFDNNLALISTVDVLKDAKKDKFVEMFVDFLNKNEMARKLFKEITFKTIVELDLERIIDNIPIKIDNTEDIIKKVYQRYTYLKNLF